MVSHVIRYNNWYDQLTIIPLCANTFLQEELMFQAVNKQALSEKVFTQIRDQILLGALKPGDKLPSERKLCDMFAVNRGAIREALKRLEQLQLIQVQHGGGTTVLDYHCHGSIELLPSLLLLNEQPNLSVLKSVLELRLALGREVVRLCTLRCSEVTLSKLEEITVSMLESQSTIQREELSTQFWKTLLIGSENIAYQLAFNTLQRTFTVLRHSFRSVLSQEWENPKQYQSMLRAMQSRNSAKAEQELSHLLVTALPSSLSNMESP